MVFHAEEKKILVVTNIYRFNTFWWINCYDTRFSSGSIYIYSFLNLTFILGISCFYHDSAAVLIVDGKIVSAVQEERFTRIKHDANFPTNSIRYILKDNKLSLNEIDYVCFYEKPFLKFERLIETYVKNSPYGFNSFKLSMPIWIKEKLFQKKHLLDELKKIDKKFDRNKLLFSEHHYSHAASAFYPSPFDEALILTLDGVGEWATTTISIGKKNSIKLVKEINFPHSLGLLYSAFTYFLGFKVNSGEYKVMGLAPYGQPRYKDLILKNLVTIYQDGSFEINQKFFNYSTGLTMTNNKFSSLFGVNRRIPEKEKLEQVHMDIAASIQEALNEIVLKIIKNISDEYKIKNICLAGGVALNCVTNSKILKSKNFEKMWIQPASGDAGGALGAALMTWHYKLKKPRKTNNSDGMNGSFLGPQFNENQIFDELNKNGAIFQTHSYEEIIEKTAKCLAENNAIGWFQGKMEFGPRALGSRSIIANPAFAEMQKNLNLKIKFRESFRPFAPSILLEHLKDWFDFNEESPYMLHVADVINDKRLKQSKDDIQLIGIEKLSAKLSVIPAVTHVDYSARIQTVNSKTNKKFYELINKFKEITSIPILINTSFNIRGEPIVCTPTDAFNCFMGTDLDYLIIENYFLSKKDQKKELLKDYKKQFELD